MRKQGLVGVFLMMVSTVAACGGGDDDDSVEAPNSLNDVCVEEGDVFCERAIECFPEGAPSQSECLSQFRASCCLDDGTCGEAVTSISVDEWADCLGAYEDFACADLDAGNLPTECLSFKPEMLARLRQASEQVSWLPNTLTTADQRR